MMISQSCSCRRVGHLHLHYTDVDSFVSEAVLVLRVVRAQTVYRCRYDIILMSWKDFGYAFDNLIDNTCN